MKTPVIIGTLSCALLGGLALGYLSTPGAPATAPGTGSGASASSASSGPLRTPDLPGGAPVPVSPAPFAKQQSQQVEENLAAALKYPSELHREYAFRRIFSALSLDQFPAVLAMLNRESGAIAVQAKKHLFRCWADLAPEDALLRALAEPDPKMRETVFSAAAREWGRRDLTAALAYIEKLPKEDTKKTFIYLQQLALRRSDSNVAPSDKLALILKDQKDNSARFAQVYELFTQWAKTDLKGATEQVANIPNGSPRAAAVSQILEVWMRKDPEAAGRWLDGLELNSKMHYQEIFAKYLAETNPDAAKAYALRQVSTRTDNRDNRFRIIDAVFNELHARDPDGAIAFFDSLPERTEQFHGEVWKLRLDADPVRASEDIVNHPIWQKEDVWWNWTDTMKNTLEPLVKKEPKAAAELITRIPKGDKGILLAQVAEQWCAKDAVAAVSWAASLPPGETQDLALREFTAAWAQYDTKQATTWLNQVPAGNARSAAAEGFARATFDTDPDGALAWLRTIPDVNDRMQRMARAWGQWLQVNSTSAADWLKDAPLDASEMRSFEAARATLRRAPER